MHKSKEVIPTIWSGEDSHFKAKASSAQIPVQAMYKDRILCQTFGGTEQNDQRVMTLIR
jgi:hypothetical protein